MNNETNTRINPLTGKAYTPPAAIDKAFSDVFDAICELPPEGRDIVDPAVSALFDEVERLKKTNKALKKQVHLIGDAVDNIGGYIKECEQNVELEDEVRDEMRELYRNIESPLSQAEGIAEAH